MVLNFKVEKFEKMVEGIVKDKDQLNMNDNMVLVCVISVNFFILVLWVCKYNVCIIFLNQVCIKIGVMFGDFIMLSGGDLLKFYVFVCICFGVLVMKDGKEKIGQDVGVECIKNKVVLFYGKCIWKFYFDFICGFDVIELFVEYMLEEGYLLKNVSG